jgi:hypothetical protein
MSHGDSTSTCGAAQARLMNDMRAQWEFAARGEVMPEAQYEAACVRDPTDALAAMDACGVVVGLYPDQATDALVNLALSTCVALLSSSHRLSLSSSRSNRSFLERELAQRNTASVDA